MTTKRSKAKGPEQSGPDATEGARIVRVVDPAGLLPGSIGIRDLDKVTPSQRPQVNAAIHEYFQRLDPRTRIQHVARHAELKPVAEALRARFEEAGNRVDDALEIDIRGAQARALYLDAAPRVIRDRRRQAGTKKPRRPEVDAWIDDRLSRDPSAKTPALWSHAPDWIVDQIGKDRFAKRVTAARKRRK